MLLSIQIKLIKNYLANIFDKKNIMIKYKLLLKIFI